jgi:phosphoribosylformylglycinamidine cyclo-ligase
VPRIFDLIRRQGDVSEQEMFHVFNMGLGMLYVVPSAQAAQAVTVCDALRVVGEIKEGEHRVEVVF